MSLRSLVHWISACAVVTVASVQYASAQTPAAPAATPPPPPPPLVKVGQPMPDFTLPYLEPATENGGRPTAKTITLSSLKGKQSVVLAFFPAAFSPG